MSSDPPRSPNFDHVARIYRFAEYLALGPLLQRTRTHFLPELPPCHQALVLGDGDGRFLAQLLDQLPHLGALAVDTSATMLRLLRHRCEPYVPRVRTLQASALDLFAPSDDMRDLRAESQDPGPPHLTPGTSPQSRAPTPESRLPPLPLAPDLIVTHFFLDCLTQPELNTLTTQISANTAPGTLWLLSDFAIPNTPILRPFARLYIRFLYLSFRVLTGLRVTHLPDPQSALTAANFTCLARHEFLLGLLYTEVWERQ